MGCGDGLLMACVQYGLPPAVWIAWSRVAQVCDLWNSTGKEPNCTVCVKVDVEGFWELMTAAIRKANGVSRS